MSSKILIIYEYQNLFEILNEISEYLSFKILNYKKKEYEKIKFNSKIDYLILSQKKIEGINNILILDNFPIKIEKLLEIINVNFLKNKFYNQSNIRIGKYNLDLNSRKISFQNKNLNLTERETNLIVFIHNKKEVTIKDLQKNVWDYSPNLETHTVETHIYRLRKKMKESFKDENFISNTNNGYSIN